MGSALFPDILQGINTPLVNLGTVQMTALRPGGIKFERYFGKAHQIDSSQVKQVHGGAG